MSTIPTIITLRPSKYLARMLDWISKASTTDPYRKALNGIFFDNPKHRLVACDGLRIHMVDLSKTIGITGADVESLNNDVPAEPNTFIPLAKILPDRPNEFEKSLNEYPDFDAAFPTTEPVFEISVNPKFLTDALQGLPTDTYSSVRLIFYADNSPFLVIYNEFTALIMPMRKG